LEYDKFYAKIWKTGNGLVITIPSNLTKHAGYKIGDQVQIMIKKQHHKKHAIRPTKSRTKKNC